MKFKLEIMMLSLGLLGSTLSISIIFMWHEIPVELRELFRGGNLGAQILGLFVFSGFIGLLLFISNLIKSQLKLWWLRSIGFICFIFLTATVGNNV